MIRRCTDPNNIGYKDYGDRGITVCEEWLKFLNFYKDMGERPKDHSLHRINNEKGYYPYNCEWATPEKQMRDTRDNLYVTYRGKTQLLIEWSEETGILYKTLWDRMYKLGWSPENALTTPTRK